MIVEDANVDHLASVKLRSIHIDVDFFLIFQILIVVLLH